MDYLWSLLSKLAWSSPLGQAKSLVLNKRSPLRKTGLPLSSDAVQIARGPARSPQTRPNAIPKPVYGLWKAYDGRRVAWERPQMLSKLAGQKSNLDKSGLVYEIRPLRL